MWIKIRPKEIAIYYIGEIKNECYFLSHVADSLFDGSNESFNPYEPVKTRKYDVPVKSYSGFKKSPNGQSYCHE